MVLAPSEMAVLRLAATGMPGKAIAHELGVPHQNVKRRLDRAYRRVGAHCLVEALYRLGWTSIPGQETGSAAGPQ